MAIRKTGSRRIVVDGIEYRWRVRRKSTYIQAAFACSFVVSVQVAEASGQVLHVTAGARPDNWTQTPGEVVTPAPLAATIRAALKAGWKPAEPGSAFYFALTSEEP
jgi:hypothetical protein